MKKLVSLIVALAIVLSICATTVHAVVSTANLAVKLSASTLEVGKEVTVTVNWTEKMEGAEFLLGYDKAKVQFVSASIADTYYTDEGDAINVAWFTAEGKAQTNITFKFKTIAEGSAKFTTSEATLVDAEVESPETYTYGSATLTVKNATKTETETKTETKEETTPTDTKTETKTETKDETTSTETKKETKTTSTPATKTETKTETKAQTKTTTKSTAKPTSIPQAGMQIAQYAVIALVVVALIGTVLIVTKKVNKK